MDLFSKLPSLFLSSKTLIRPIFVSLTNILPFESNKITRGLFKSLATIGAAQDGLGFQQAGVLLDAELKRCGQFVSQLGDIQAALTHAAHLVSDRKPVKDHIDAMRAEYIKICQTTTTQDPWKEVEERVIEAVRLRYSSQAPLLLENVVETCILERIGTGCHATFVDGLEQIRAVRHRLMGDDSPKPGPCCTIS